MNVEKKCRMRLRLSNISNHITSLNVSRVKTSPLGRRSGRFCESTYDYAHIIVRVSDPDPQDPHVFALPGSGQKGKEMNE